MTPLDDSQLTAARMADLAALADGSLPERRRAEVEALLAGSPALAEAVAEQRRAVSAVHAALADDGAPARLRERVPRMRRARGARPRRVALATATATATAVVAVLLAVGAPGDLTVAQAVVLADRGPTATGAGPDPEAPTTRLAESVQDVYFPNWTGTPGWRATGQRTDELGGRSAVTVYYASAGRVIAYTILGTPALPPPPGRAVSVAGTSMRVLTVGGRTVLTWQRDGHTCVLSTRGTAVATLERLATWRSSTRT